MRTNKTKKTARITLMNNATVLEYKVHIMRKLDKWKNNSYRIKNVKHVLDSCFILSTALCMLDAPSPPLNARPGPSIEQSAAIVIQSSPKAIPQVVVDKYPNWIHSGTLFAICRPSPP